MKKYCLRIILLGLALALLSGCAPRVKKPPEEIGRVPFEVLKKDLCQIYARIGREYERAGKLVSALKHYKLALTVSPFDQEADEGRRRVERELRNSAQHHYEAGLKLHKDGKYAHARHQFLIVLRLWPSHEDAARMLITRKRIQTKRYIVHTIQPGQNLSKLAEIYYGDYHKFPLIAEYNNIMDATQVRVGQEIKVPEVEGVAFKDHEEFIEPDGTDIGDLELWEWDRYASEKQGPVEKATAAEKHDELLDQVASYREDGVELFMLGYYQEAIDSFNKVLNVSPRDDVAREYACKSHMRQGMLLFEGKDYLAARDEFEACLRYKGDCQECVDYLEKSKISYKEEHYKQGIQFFDEEQLTEAIREWNLVWSVDPNYKRVDYLITKAKTILKNIQELRKEGQEELDQKRFHP
jgi:tetratricopeptide (TPR) repeat protein